jgi:hypothetical protein
MAGVVEIIREGSSGFTWAIIPACIAALGSVVAAVVTARSRRSLVKDVQPALVDTQAKVHHIDQAVNQTTGPTIAENVAKATEQVGELHAALPDVRAAALSKKEAEGRAPEVIPKAEGHDYD